MAVKKTIPLAPSLSPAIPIDTQRALRRLEGQVNTLHARLDEHRGLIDGKLGSSPADLLTLTGYVRDKLQASGSHPLSIAGLPGVAAQAQKTVLKSYSSAPGGVIAQGSLAIINGQPSVYIDGQWVALGGGGGIADLHDNRASYAVGSYPSGTVYFETDRNVLYVDTPAGWIYAAGVMLGVAASKPADLGTNDKGFQYYATDEHDFYTWDGSAWSINGATYG